MGAGQCKQGSASSEAELSGRGGACHPMMGAWHSDSLQTAAGWP